MNIQKGKQKRAQIIVIYGVAGIGKSTLASYSPRPLFLDTEHGSGQLDVDRVDIENLADLGDALAHIRAGLHPEYKTVVIDTGDNLWRMCADAICAEHKWKNIEEPAYGKGYPYVLQRQREVQDVLSDIRNGGTNVILICHAAVERMNPPDAEEYTRYTLKMATAPSKQAASAGELIKEWADCIIFCRHTITTSSNGKAVGESERVIEVSPAPAWEAKNRYGLTEAMPLCRDSFMRILEAAGLPDDGTAPKVAVPAAQEPAQAAQRLDFDEALLVEYFAATGRLQPGQTLVDLNAKLRAAIQERPADAMQAARAWKAKQEGGEA